MTINRPLCLLALLFCVCLQSCLPDKPGIYKGEEIPSGTKSKMRAINDDLLRGLKTNNRNDLELLMSRELIATGYQNLRTTEKASLAMKDAEYSLLADYYVVNKLKQQGEDLIKERGMGVNNFDFTVDKAAQYTYVALFTAKSAPQKKLITALYHKLDYGWKLTDLEVEPYADNGKTAPESMIYAKELLKKGYWIDAINAAASAGQCLRPSSYAKYVQDQAIYDFCKQTGEDVSAQYTLPIVMKSVPTQPKIWRLKLERTKEGTFPNINYISKINLLDTMALRKENELVGKAIGQVFKGIDKDKKYIYYTIYKETKQGVPYRDHYDLRQTL